MKYPDVPSFDRPRTGYYPYDKVRPLDDRLEELLQNIDGLLADCKDASYFEDRLRAIRKILDYTQKDFAAEIGISRGTYSGVESQGNPPSKKLQLFLVERLGFSWEWLMYGKPPVLESDKKDVEIKEKELPTIGKSDLIKLIDIISVKDYDLVYRFLNRLIN